MTMHDVSYLHLVHAGEAVDIPVSPVQWKTLGRSKIVPDQSSPLGQELIENNCDTVYLALGYVESVGAAYRHVVIVRGNVAGKVAEQLRNDTSAMDSWVVFHAKSLDGDRVSVFLLTQQQADNLHDVEFHPAATLENGQCIRSTEEPDVRKYGDWYMLSELRVEPVADASYHTRQLFPYNRLGLEESQAPISVMLSPSDRKHFGRHPVVLIPFLDADGNRSSSEPFPIAAEYRKEVPQGRACLHETLLYALGYCPGDLVELIPSNKPLPLVERLPFLQRRRIIAIAQSPTDFDVGYPVARLAQQAIDVLGIADGEHIVINGRSLTRARPLKSGVPVRCLPMREPFQRLGVDGGNLPKNTVIPAIEIDLIRREQIGVSTGEIVIVRPAFGSLFLGELALLTNAVAIGAAASVFTMQLEVIAGTFLVLALTLWVNFKRRFA